MDGDGVALITSPSMSGPAIRRCIPASPLLGCAAILVDFIGLGMISPILPGIVDSSGVGVILSAQYIAVVFGQVVIAALAEKFGRRRAIVAVMYVDAITFAATGFFTDVTALIVLRLIAGFAAPVVLGISYVASVSRDASPSRAQFNFAMVGISFNLGSLIGAATGGLLGADLWLPANLVAGAVPAIVAGWAMLSYDVPDEGGPPLLSAHQPPSKDPAAPAPAVTTTGTAAAPSAARPALAEVTSVEVISAEVSRSVLWRQSGLRAALVSPDVGGVLIAYLANGIFQGTFFSLMPVILSDARWISAVIIAASGAQIAANLLLVRPSVRRFGSLGHTTWTNGLVALLVTVASSLVGFREVPDAALVSPDAALVSPDAALVSPDAALVSPAWAAAFSVVYAIAYVFSATSLTVLNQSTTKYALRHGAAVGTLTGITRTVFSIAFGISPIMSIALYTRAAWLPFGIMAAASAAACCCFGIMQVRGFADPLPQQVRTAPATSVGTSAQTAVARVASSTSTTSTRATGPVEWNGSPDQTDDVAVRM